MAKKKLACRRCGAELVPYTKDVAPGSFAEVKALQQDVEGNYYCFRHLPGLKRVDGEWCYDIPLGAEIPLARVFRYTHTDSKTRRKQYKTRTIPYTVLSQDPHVECSGKDECFIFLNRGYYCKKHKKV